LNPGNADGSSNEHTHEEGPEADETLKDA